MIFAGADPSERVKMTAIRSELIPSGGISTVARGISRRAAESSRGENLRDKRG
jgi:hypothetical protein